MDGRRPGSSGPRNEAGTSSHRECAMTEFEHDLRNSTTRTFWRWKRTWQGQRARGPWSTQNVGGSATAPGRHSESPRLLSCRGVSCHSSEQKSRKRGGRGSTKGTCGPGRPSPPRTPRDDSYSEHIRPSGSVTVRDRTLAAPFAVSLPRASLKDLRRGLGHCSREQEDPERHVAGVPHLWGQMKHGLFVVCVGGNSESCTVWRGLREGSRGQRDARWVLGVWRSS